MKLGCGDDDPGVAGIDDATTGSSLVPDAGHNDEMSSWSFTLRAGVATAVDGLSVAHARGGVQLHAPMAGECQHLSTSRLLVPSRSPR
jgi:hypothetical protein